MTNAELTANFECVYESLSYEKLKFQDDPSSKAQIFRQTAAQQYYAGHSEIMDEDHEASLVAHEDTLKEYFNIMDEKEPSKGLDNCSRGVQALCSGFKNESKQWHLRDLKSNSLFQKLENELRLETAASAGSQSSLERTLELILNLEGKPQSACEKPYPSTATKVKPLDSDMSSGINKNTLFNSNAIPRFSYQEKKDLEDSSSILPRFSFQEKKVPDDIQNTTVFRYPYQEKKIPEDLPASISRFSFQEKKCAEDPPRFINKPPMIVERKQEDIPKPRYPPFVERKQEDANRNGALPQRRTDDAVKPTNPSAFRTAREQFIVDQKKKNSGNSGNNAPTSAPVCAPRAKSLGPRRTLKSPFVLPIKDQNKNDDNESGTSDSKNQSNIDNDKPLDERLKNIEPKMVELIENEIMDSGAPVHWDDIAGLEFAKNTIKEIVVWPMLRPDIFTGLRGPPRGILLFGPPGTGKTLIGKCIASQSRSTFFSISASSLTSKWVGEGEKMVRALFAVARVHQPSVIFIDEIDSLLSQRSDTEHESSRRIKTEFLVQLDGATTSSDDRLLVVGATNRPQELDEAARRRLVKRLYIPLPEFPARKQIIVHLMSAQRHVLEDEQINEICHRTDGYSCADMTNLCKEAAFGPIRSISLEDIEFITADQVRPITKNDFEAALSQVRASVSTQDLALYEDWNSRYGSGAK